MGMAAEIEPELVIESDCIDDQSVSFKVPDRVAVPSRIEIVQMLRLVQKDLTVAVNVSLKQKKDVRGRLDDPPGIGRDAWNAGWQAIRLGIVFRLSGLHNLFRFR